MAEEQEFGQLVGGGINVAEKSEAETAGTNTLFLSINYGIRLKSTRIKVEQRNIGGDVLIWGSGDFGLWGTYKWGSAPTNSFILGHISAGVLGTAQLGSNVSSWGTVETIYDEQTLTDNGRAEVVKFLDSDATVKYPDSLIVGTDSTEFNSTDSTLKKPVGVQDSWSTDVVTNKIATFIGSINSVNNLNGSTIKEVGLTRAGTEKVTLDTDAGQSEANIAI
jgi:hypothetical protein|tara:strand:+ start:26179 stop:26841 length:663 start_codon:yes stop_codon:yes gene_type:complete